MLGPHKGIPNVLMSGNNQVEVINPSLIPEPDDAACTLYEAHGGQIILFGDFGIDPLLQRSGLLNIMQRNKVF